jgi:hypothetical protein
LRRGPERASEGEFDWRDALIGEEIGGELRVPNLTVSGMRIVQGWFAQETAAPPERSAVEDAVLLAAFDLVDRSLSHVKTLALRVVMSRSEEWRVCIWDTASADARVHVWRLTPNRRVWP